MRYFACVGLLILAAGAVAGPDEGQALYDTFCGTCHGAAGKGDGVGVPDTMLRPRPFALNAFKFDTDADWRKGTDADLANVIRNGTAAYGGSRLMPPWPQLTERQVSDLVAYVRSLQRN